jgi:simple sugar transport system ATP-binding protein
MPESPLLSLKNVSKEYYGTRVLNNVNFSLDRGEILALVGENGAGKSTLMNIIFGMPVIAQTGGYGGEIVFDGKPAAFTGPLDALEAGIGMVHQEFSLIPGFSACENIMLNREPVRRNFVCDLFGDRMATLRRDVMRERSAAAIAKLGVGIDTATLVAEMPVGHKQFTEIAREIDRDNVKLLVLDEPTAVLTESEAEILLGALRRLADAGIAIIFISHRLREVTAIADRIVVLRDGEIVKETPTKGVSISQIAEWMIGRAVGGGAVGAGLKPARTPALTAPSQSRSDDNYFVATHLWVDMPGETVRDVSFSVTKGEIFGIGGLAGQGKLGIPNGIMGLCAAGGDLTFDGKALAINKPRTALDAGMAFVSEDRRGVGLLLDETLEWNIAFGAMQNKGQYLKRYLGGLITQRDEAAMKTLADKYIEELQIKCTGSKQRAKELSGGNQQKVCLAKAFAMQPQLLFVSEPTRGIDVGAKKLVLDTLRRVNRELGVTIVMVSSELAELSSICDRIAIVAEGRIAGILPPDAEPARFGLLMSGEAA